MNLTFKHISVCALALAFALGPVWAGGQKRSVRQKAAAKELRSGNNSASGIAGKIQQAITSAQDSTGDFITMASNFSLGDYKLARWQFSNYLKQHPNDDASWYYLGICELLSDNYGKGLECLKKAVSLDSTNYWYKERLALAYDATGNTELAISLYEKMYRDYPKKTDALYALINLYLKNNEVDKALASIKEMETQMGKTDATVMTSVQILRHQGKPEEAIKLLEEYSGEYTSPWALTMLGDYAASAYSDTSAARYYDEALAIDRDYSPALLGKAESLRTRGKFSEYFAMLQRVMSNKEVPATPKCEYIKAIASQTDPKFLSSFIQDWDKVVDTALVCHPSDSIMLNTAASFYYATERKDKAIGIFKRSMDTFPEDPGKSLTYAEALVRSGKMEEAESVIDSLIPVFKDKVPAQLDLLQMSDYVAYSKNDFKRIVANSEKVLYLAPKDSAATLSAYSSMGDAYHSLGEKSKAYTAYEAALKVNPDYAPVLNNYAYYLSIEGKKMKKAYEMSKKTVDAEPENATYLDTFGWILHLMGKDTEAKPFFKQAMLYGGKESSTILYHYSTVLEKLGETDLAKVYKGYGDAKAKEGK